MIISAHKNGITFKVDNFYQAEKIADFGGPGTEIRIHPEDKEDSYWVCWVEGTPNTGHHLFTEELRIIRRWRQIHAIFEDRDW